jgi:flagellar FliL protein
MATAPKTAPKVVPKAAPAPEPVAEAPAAKKSKKKFILIAIAVLLLLGAIGGGSAWYFQGQQQEAADPAAPPVVKNEPAKPPVFVTMEPFTVNLQTESGEQFLQVTLTLQVSDQAQVDLIKLYMPLVRSRLLLLLSGKKAGDISTVDGKKTLSEEIVAAVKQPFAPKSPPQNVTGVFFTSFVIQ